MPSKGGLIYYLICLLYTPFLGKLWDSKIMNLASNCKYPLWFSLMCRKWVCLSLSLSSLEWKSTASIITMSYSVSRCCQWSSMLQATRFSSNKTTLHLIVSLCKDTIKQLQQETPDFIGPDLWLPNSPDMSLMDYEVWGVMQQRVYECRMNNVNELKLRVIDVWNKLQQNVTDAAINDWRKH